MAKIRKRRRWGKIVFLLIVCFIFILIAMMFLKPRGNTNQVQLPPFTVKKTKAFNKIEISGYIEAARQQKLESPGTGIISDVFVKEGARVRKGTVLFCLDDDVQRYNLASQAFAIEQEKINGAPKKLKLMEQRYALLQKELNDRRVVAEFDGIIASLNVSKGEYAKPQDRFGTLIDRSYLKASIEIPESDTARLKVGQKVELVFPAQPNLQVVGKVTAYPSIARVTNSGRTVVDAEIRVDNPPEQILPGYSFNGVIVAGEDTDILTLEQQAIRYEQGVPFVDKIVEPGKTEAIKVTIAPYIRGFVKVVEGLHEGDTVVNHTVENPNFSGRE